MAKCLHLPELAVELMDRSGQIALRTLGTVRSLTYGELQADLAPL